MTEVANNSSVAPDGVMLSMLPGGAEAWDASRPPVEQPGSMPWVETEVNVYSHPDVKAVLANQEQYSRPLYKFDELPYQPMVMAGVWALNRPEHDEVETHLGRFFGHPAVMRLVPGVIDTRINDAITGIVESGTGEFNYGSTIGRITPRVMADVLGMQPDDPEMIAWLTGVNMFDSSPEQAAREAAAQAKFIDLIGQAQADLRQNPRPAANPIQGLAAALNAEAPVAGKPMTQRMAASQVAVMLAASLFTTVATKGNTFQGMSENDLWPRLQANPSLVPIAAATATRRYTASPIAFGMTRGEVTVGEGSGAKTLPPYTFVNGHINPANFDPKVFEEPFRFDPSRPDDEAQSLSFATGWRTCMGIALAKTIIERTVAAAAQRLPGIQWDGQPVQRAPFGFVRPIMPGTAPGEDMLNFTFDLGQAKDLARERIV